jgi:predicted ribonuclease YlaK
MTDAETKVLAAIERLEQKWEIKWDKVVNEMMQGRIELARLTTTVEQHEKRSTTLEIKQQDCQETCQAQIKAAQEIAQSALEISNSFKSGMKWIVGISGALLTVIALAASVVQILDYMSKH